MSFLKHWFSILTGHILLWLCLGSAFFLFVRSIVHISWEHAGVLTACYAFAWLCGFLSFLTPSGLGIREGILGLLLANYMSTSQAMLIALLCRVWMMSSEIILAGIAFFLKNWVLHHTEEIKSSPGYSLTDESV